ncbi:unnamed protein product [Calypogeia fissa]
MQVDGLQVMEAKCN